MTAIDVESIAGRHPTTSLLCLHLSSHVGIIPAYVDSTTFIDVPHSPIVDVLSQPSYLPMKHLREAC